MVRYWKGVLFIALAVGSLLWFSGCKPHTAAPALFEVLDHAKTGLEFRNTLKPTSAFNVFKYMYFYNGAGVGAGDFNKDGLTDLFFAANQGENKLYLNKGNLEF